jgi:Right handed beta helix region
MNQICNTRCASSRRGWRLSHLYALPLLTLLPLGLGCRDGAIVDATEETTAQTDTGLPAVGAPQAVTLAGAVAAGCPSSGFTRLVAVSTASQLASALSKAQPGDQIRLAAGTYRGRMSLYRAGTASARITLCGMPGAWPVLTGGRFRLSGSFITVTGLVFAGPNGSDANVYMASPHDILFTHNEVRNSDWHAGVSVEGSYNVTIADNYFHDNGGVSGEIDHGIYYHAQHTTSSTRNLIANNIIVGGVGRGISMHDNGGGAISYTTVTGNTIVRNGSTGILVATNAGSGNVIANNVIADNGIKYSYKQIRIKTGSGNSVLNNIVWSPTASRSGIEIFSGTRNTIIGNVEQNPLFVTPYSDLHLRAGSPAIGLALSTYSVSPDFDGTTRDGSPNAGAYEQ